MRLTLATVMVFLAASSLAFPSCADIPGNVAAPCGFESLDEVEQWTTVIGVSSLSLDPVRSGAGAARLQSGYDDGYQATIVMPNVLMSPTGPLTFHVYVLAMDDSVGLTCHIWAVLCEEAPPPVTPDFCDLVIGWPTYVEPGSGWTIVSLGGTLGPHAPLDYGRVEVSCSASSPFTIFVDDVFLGEDPDVVVVFVDGFESGNISAWELPSMVVRGDS
jgi:hypothetical protein